MGKNKHQNNRPKKKLGMRIAVLLLTIVIVLGIIIMPFL